MNNLEKMKRLYREWYNEKRKSLNGIVSKELIEKKLIEIANKYDYCLFERTDESIPQSIWLTFYNNHKETFLDAHVSERGFTDEESDHLDF